MGPPGIAPEAVAAVGTLDLKADEGRDTLLRLVETADVLVENYRPDVKFRLGIDYETLAAINPRLVFFSSSLMGQSGPLRNYAGFGEAQALHLREPAGQGLHERVHLAHALLGEPLRLAALELVVLLSGSLLEGLVIAWILVGRTGVGVSD